MEEDILNYLPTVMFRGTPCLLHILDQIEVLMVVNYALPSLHGESA